MSQPRFWIPAFAGMTAFFFKTAQAGIQNREGLKNYCGCTNANNCINPAAAKSPSNSARLAVRIGNGCWRWP
ncbi:hypothetical protein GCM10017655_38910 [Pseudomonas turukhanskensis]|uniref:Uncharacterized protein n=1 Tax=Pseudomonas turukhanskensis TaxID=1806536 RepID=A0A9W6K8N7_9PSED|nr:hypothetical protein GCM10017655_38910 [Pseudomonas turukhanskensis]